MSKEINIGNVETVNTWCDVCNKRTKSFFFGARFVCTECETESNYEESEMSTETSDPAIIIIPNKETKELSQTCCRLIAGLIKNVKDTTFTLEETDTHFIHKIELRLKKRGDG
ncbi:MAG: hypothetical protein V3V19_11110 [Cocleimonas sp.]